MKILDFFLIQDVLTPKHINIGLLQFLATVSKHGIAILMTHSLMTIAKREFSIRTGWDIVQQNHDMNECNPTNAAHNVLLNVLLIIPINVMLKQPHATITLEVPLDTNAGAYVDTKS